MQTLNEMPLLVSPVFKALSKPLLMLGVHYDYFFIEGLFVMLVFISMGNFLAFLLLLPLHTLGIILTHLDPHIFKLLSVRASIGVVKNKFLWRCQTYAPF